MVLGVRVPWYTMYTYDRDLVQTGLATETANIGLISLLPVHA